MRCHRPLILASVVAVASFSLLAAGCGSGGSAGVASVASSTTAATTTTQNATPQLVAFSRCMRSHGVPNFPDPQRVSGRSLKLTVHQLAASDPRFPEAERACEHLLPNGGSGPEETAQQARTQLADALSFATVQAQGIDVHSPAFLRVVQACLPASHGGLTLAKVREALRHAGG